MKTTVKFRLAVADPVYATATFPNGVDAYDWIRHAINVGAIVCLSNVRGPGAGDYTARAVELVDARVAAASRRYGYTSPTNLTDEEISALPPIAD
jgi:hypothetical protein